MWQPRSNCSGIGMMAERKCGRRGKQKRLGGGQVGAGGHGVFVLGQRLGLSLNCWGRTTRGGAAGGRGRNWVLEGQVQVRSTRGTSRHRPSPV